MCKQESSSCKSTKIYTIKELLLRETTIMIFIPDSTLQPSKSWLFIYHMYAYLIQTTVMKCYALPSNDVNNFKMFYVFVIMLRGQFKSLMIKYNQNTIVVIYQCLQRVLHWNIIVHYKKLISIQLHHNFNVMQCFTIV